MGKQFLFGRGKLLQRCIALACQSAFLLMGYDQGVYSSVVSNPDFLEKVGHPGDVELGIIVASYNLGCFLGTIFAFVFCERLGRRWSIWVAMGWIMLGAVLQCSAFSRAHLVIGRVICGVGTGIDTATVPMYQSELSEPHRRGRLVSAELFCVTVGILFAYWFDYGMNYVDNSSSWRLPIATQILIALVPVFIVFGIPESPRYLCKMGKSEEALEVLSCVYDKPTDHRDVVKEHGDIMKARAIESGYEQGWAQLFKRDRVRTNRRILLSYGINSLNQLCGINVIVYFIPTVLNVNVGLSGNMSQLVGGLINFCNTAGSIFPVLFADKYGRRRPLMLGAGGLAFCMMMVAILLSFKGNPEIGQITAKVSVAFFFLYMLIFGIGIGCFTWVYGPEVLPLHVRAKGNAMGISAVWLWNFVVVMVTPVLINRVQWGTYLIFAVLNFVYVPILYSFYPELTNMTLEEVDDVFTADVSPVKAAAQIQANRLQRLDNNPDDSGTTTLSNSETVLSQKALEEVRLERIG